MTIATGAAEVLLVANKPGLTETGGGHGAKGVDFQRWWAVLRLLELEQSNAPDFLLLFEAVQDVTELDSVSAPTKAAIYQVKKKDTGTWSWSVLTGTSVPKQPKAAKKTKSATSAPAAPTPTAPPKLRQSRRKRPRQAPSELDGIREVASGGCLHLERWLRRPTRFRGECCDFAAVLPIRLGS